MIFFHSRLKSMLNSCGFFFQTFINSGIFHQKLQHRRARCHSHRIAGKGAGLINRPYRGYTIHNLSAAAVNSHRHTAADNLTEGSHIRCDTVIGLGTAKSQPKTGNNFIKNQHGAVLLCDITQPLKKAIFRRYNTHIGCHWLHDQCCDLVPVLFKQFSDTVQIIVSGDQRCICESLRHTGAVRYILCQKP